MVFDYIIYSLEGRVMRTGQIHVLTEGINQEQKAMVEALAKLSSWLEEHPLGSLPGAISLHIAYVPIPQKG